MPWCRWHAAVIRGLCHRWRRREAADAGEEIFYTVDTVRRFRRKSAGAGDRLYFLLGRGLLFADRELERLQNIADACVILWWPIGPGFRSRMLYSAIAPELLARPQDAAKAGGSRKPISIALRHSTVYLLDAVSSDVSATDVRRRLKTGNPYAGLCRAAWRTTLKNRLCTSADDHGNATSRTAHGPSKPRRTNKAAQVTLLDLTGLVSVHRLSFCYAPASARRKCGPSATPSRNAGRARSAPPASRRTRRRGMAVAGLRPVHRAYFHRTCCATITTSSGCGARPGAPISPTTLPKLRPREGESA